MAPIKKCQIGKTKIKGKCVRKLQKSYIYTLKRNGRVVDQTSIDDRDVNFAKELFYGEFGHKKKPKDKVELIREEWD